MDKNSFGPRLAYPLPLSELERRWTAISAAMEKEGVDCIVMQSTDNVLGGYTRYLTDFPVYGYQLTVFYHKDGDVYVIGHGAEGSSSVPPFAQRGRVQGIAVPLMTTLNYTDDYAPGEVVKLAKKYNCKRIGVIAKSIFSSAAYLHIQENVPGAEMVDATDMLDRIKAIKSEVEIDLIRKTVRIHDKIGEAMPAICRLGRYEYEVVNDLKKLAADFGCEAITVNMGADKVFPAMVPFRGSQYKKLEPGDMLICLVEVSGPGGYYGELGRVWSMGEPTEEVAKAMQVAVDCQKEIVNLLKPGANPVDLFNKNNEYLTSRGYDPEGRLYAHGQGYDMVERPAFAPGETMLLEENMFIAIHPSAIDKTANSFCCDNYLITRDGAEHLTKIPQELIII